MVFRSWFHARREIDPALKQKTAVDLLNGPEQTSVSRKILSPEAMLLLQLLRQPGAFIEIRRQLYRASKRIGQGSLSRAAVLPIASHHPQLLSDYLCKRRVTCPRLLLRKLQNFRIQVHR